ncbi:uncharacterized protein LOC132206754 [Stegostoma tigrinum]|uniref:uncharacterized protein LOC132206754 n=1 Tax=Stegostoma tigrinum TaxID=3053191 RepID=UPI002870285E|nr:uncharacterized protein LOC132206754 [Stegostoma tigrinum]
MEKDQELLQAVKTEDVAAVQKLLQRPKQGKANKSSSSPIFTLRISFHSKVIGGMFADDYALLSSICNAPDTEMPICSKTWTRSTLDKKKGKKTDECLAHVFVFGEGFRLPDLKGNARGWCILDKWAGLQLNRKGAKIFAQGFANVVRNFSYGPPSSGQLQFPLGRKIHIKLTGQGNGTLTGGVSGTEKDVSLTAFVTKELHRSLAAFQQKNIQRFPEWTQSSPWKLHHDTTLHF